MTRTSPKDSSPGTPAPTIAGVPGRLTPPDGWAMVPHWWRRSLRLHALAWRDLAVGTAWLCCLLVLAFPLVARLDRRIRRNAQQQRALARLWGGRSVPARYRTRVDPVAHGYGASAEQVVGYLREPLNRRDLRWHLVNILVGGIISLLPAVLVWELLWGLAQPFIWPDWHGVIDRTFVDFFPVTNRPTAIIGAVWGVVVFVLTMRWYGAIVRFHARWVGWGLRGDDAAELADQLRAAQRSRRTALDLQAAELKRVERDLHDGPQVKLVGSGMGLAAAQLLIDTDPDAAREQIRTSQAQIAEALAEIRMLVRGILPPVLADRGLHGALQAACAACPIDALLDDRLTRPVPEVLQAGLYFAVNESLANAAKHSGARQVRVAIAESGDGIEARVEDDGRGGAVAEPGGGLDGIGRRVAALEGRLAVTSPQGGPTVVTIWLPNVEE